MTRRRTILWACFRRSAIRHIEDVLQDARLLPPDTDRFTYTKPVILQRCAAPRFQQTATAWLLFLHCSMPEVSHAGLNKDVRRFFCLHVCHTRWDISVSIFVVYINTMEVWVILATHPVRIFPQVVAYSTANKKQDAGRPQHLSTRTTRRLAILLSIANTACIEIKGGSGTMLS